MSRIESLLSARRFLAPQLVDNRIYFISDLSGRFSLYAMDYGGSVPEPLLPPHIALQNPELIGGEPFRVYPTLGQILVMVDKDGDEKYQPMLVPIEGGFPELAFGDRFEGFYVFATRCYPEDNTAYFIAGSHTEAMFYAFQANLETRELVQLGNSPWGRFPSAANDDYTRAILIDGYTPADNVLYLWEKGADDLRLLYGTPLEERKPGQVVPSNALVVIHFTPGDRGMLCTTALFSDSYSIGYIAMEQPQEVKPVALKGTVHQGVGEMTDL